MPESSMMSNGIVEIDSMYPLRVSSAAVSASSLRSRRVSSSAALQRALKGIICRRRAADR